MGTRELIILILGLAIVGVVLRGLYVAINARRGQIKLAIDKNIPQDIDLDALEMSELPNGGARVIPRNSASTPRSDPQPSVQALGAGDALDANDAEPIPMLMDAVEVGPVSYRGAEPNEHVQIDSEPDYPGTEADESPATSALEDFRPDNTRPNDALTDSESDELLFDYQDSSPSMGSGFDSVSSTTSDWGDEEADIAETGEGSGYSPLYNVGSPDSTSDSAAISPSNPAEFEDHTAQGREAAAETQDDEIWYEAEASSSPHELNDRQFGEFASEQAEEIAPLRPPEQQAEQAADPRTFEDELGSFSFSAGERIGQRKTHQQPVVADIEPETAIDDQPELFEPLDDYEDELVERAEEEMPDASADTQVTARPTVSREQDVGHARSEGGLSSRLKGFVPNISRPTFLRGQISSELHSDGVQLEQKPFEESLAPTDEVKKAQVVDIKDAPPSVAETSATTLRAEPSEVIVLSIMAGDGYEYHGADLLQVLLSQGLTFGDMNIFHRRAANSLGSAASARDPVVFSLANIVNPGVFDLNKINEFRTPGVSLFLALPSPINNIDAFEDMLQVAQQICGQLGGELKDDQRNGMTAQTIEHYRQRIRDFELLRLKSASQRS